MNPRDEHGWSAWDYARHICHELEEIRKGISDGDSPPVHRVKRPFVVTADATGYGFARIAVRAGTSLSLLTYAWQLTYTGAVSGYVAFYRDSEDGTNLLKVDTATDYLDDSFNAEGHYLPGMSHLIIVLRGVPANATLAGNVTGRQVEHGETQPTTHSGT